MSILIVGVGQADFSQMDALDGDQARLSAGGRVASRDIVQFVPLRDFMHTSGPTGVPMLGDISKALLAELPGQLLEWMQQHRITPNPRPAYAGFATPGAGLSASIPPAAFAAPPPSASGGGGYV